MPITAFAVLVAVLILLAIVGVGVLLGVGINIGFAVGGRLGRKSRVAPTPVVRTRRADRVRVPDPLAAAILGEMLGDAPSDPARLDATREFQRPRYNDDRRPYAPGRARPTRPV